MRNELVHIQDLDTTTTSQWLVPSQFVARSIREAVCTCPCTHILNYVKVKLVAYCIT